MVDNNVRFISRNREKLSKLKSAGIGMTGAAVLSLDMGKAEVKSVRHVGKFSQCNGTI